jgi:hypothetical protein
MREKRRADLRLELTYAPEAAERVREMVRRERECCAFLDFKLQKEADAVRLTIVAPEGAREAAEMLFEPFQIHRLRAGASFSVTAARLDSR